jgi:hypothetical protein
MTIEKGRISILISAFLTLVILGAAPATVSATELVPPTDGPVHGAPSQPPNTSTGTENTGTGTVTQDHKPPTDNSNSTIPSPEPTVTPEQTQTEVEDFQQQGTTYLMGLRDKQKNSQQQTGNTQSQTQTTENRQKHCQQLQSRVDKQLSTFSSNAQKHLSTFNTIYTKVQSYAASSNNTSTELTSLLAAANTQQANATQAVDALKSLSVSIDCTSTDPASSLSTFKAAVDSTRTALQAYQKAIAAVISNLESSSKQQ